MTGHCGTLYAGADERKMAVYPFTPDTGQGILGSVR